MRQYIFHSMNHAIHVSTSPVRKYFRKEYNKRSPYSKQKKNMRNQEKEIQAEMTNKQCLIAHLQGTSFPKHNKRGVRQNIPTRKVQQK